MLRLTEQNISMNNQTLEVTIEKLTEKGSGLATLGNKRIETFGVIPDEKVLVEVQKKRRKILQAIPLQVIEASSKRVAPRDRAYLSTSPWQIMSAEAEKYYKQELSQNNFNGLGISFEEMYQSKKLYEYRNKMEFSVYEENNSFELAFYKRAARGKITVRKSNLAHDWLNKAAQFALEYINKQDFNGRIYKSIIVRTNEQQEAIVAIFVTKKIDFKSVELPSSIKGLTIFYSDPLSPASIPTEIISQIGSSEISEIIDETELKYGINSFFQVNVQAFQKALALIKDHIDENSQLLDYFSGVGSISIPLNKRLQSCLLVDSNPESIKYAKINIRRNKKKNFKAICNSSEKMLDYINQDVHLILDPPRGGIHKNLLERICSAKPRKISYLSCNPQTQARELAVLLDFYTATHAQLFNFFPRTPHCESLVLLERKAT